MALDEELVDKVQANMRSLLSTEDVALWGEWMECTPATLDEVHASDRPLPLKMPMKCTAIRAAGDLVVLALPPREQVELISFANPDGGRGAPPALASIHLNPTVPLTKALLARCRVPRGVADERHRAAPGGGGGPRGRGLRRPEFREQVNIFANFCLCLFVFSSP